MFALAHRTFELSDTYYRYSATLNEENGQIADLLIRLARAEKSWGSGLCFLSLRNVRCICEITNGFTGYTASWN